MQHRPAVKNGPTGSFDPTILKHRIRAPVTVHFFWADEKTITGRKGDVRDASTGTEHEKSSPVF